MVKQMIVMRKDLNMRKGKMIAQGCHAALGSLTNAQDDVHVSEWLKTGQTKICVSVISEEELKKVYNEAIGAGLPAYLVLDAGRTEFKEPTYTCCGIGPAPSELVDKITGNLLLL